jgi:outer membrane protein OmpA-like peptidoglycan-associated protein
MRAWIAIVLAVGCGGGAIHVIEKRPLVVTADMPAQAPPPKADPPPKRVVVKKDRIEVNQVIEFEPSSWKVTEDSQTILDEIAKVMNDHPEVKKVRIEGHTDNQGDAAHNLSLSHKRANNIMHYLVAHGVDANRLDAKGFGDTKPIADNATDEGRAQNRRVVFVIVERSDKGSKADKTDKDDKDDSADDDKGSKDDDK